ncbi:jg21005, partial [Pararge aegeria aegeria]
MERCKALDGHKIAKDFVKASEEQTISVEEQLGTELDDPQHTTLQPDEFPFGVTTNNICITSNEKASKGLQHKPECNETLSIILNKLNNYKTTQLHREENIPADNDWNVPKEWVGLNFNAKRCSNKKFVQQAFHPSLFLTRPRSSSVGSSSTSNIGCKIPTTATTTTAKDKADSWQQDHVPEKRKRKRKENSPNQNEKTSKFTKSNIQYT